MGKHSPGPWRWEAPRDGWMFLLAADGQRILGVPVGDVKEPPGLAPNAVLLASGPELYELIPAFVTSMESLDSLTVYERKVVAAAKALLARIDGGGDHG